MPKPVRILASCILLLLLLAPASCSDTPGTPEASPSIMPAATIVPGDFSIAFIEQDRSFFANMPDCMGRLQRLLNDRGWKVRLQLKLVGYTDPEPVTAEQLIRTETAAGKACDGYLVSDEAAAKLYEAGLTQDPRDIVRKEAPAMYARFKCFFDGNAAGFPAYVRTHTKGYPAALILPRETTDASGIETLSDVLGWLERTDPKWIIGAYANDSSFYPSLLDAWAGERGYYPLSLYGMSGDFYAAYGDETCTPVPVETIDGFQAFADRCAALIAGGRIINFVDAPKSNSADVCGYLGSLRTRMDQSFLFNRSRTGRDYVAYPLKGCAYPCLSPDEADIYGVVAIPSGSACAGQVAKLMEWVSTDQDGFNLVNYGEPGVDYRVVDGLIEPLNQGRPMTADDWNAQTSKAFDVSAPSLFHEADMSRATVYAVSNYTAAIEAQYPPVWDTAALRGVTYECTLFADIEADMQPTILSRTIFLSGLITNGLDDVIRDRCKELMQTTKEDTDKLARRYAERIQELKDKQRTGMK